MRYVIEDDLHAEWVGEFETLDDAVQQLRRLAATPWDQQPNQAPCIDWKTCGRNYFLIEFDDTFEPWQERSRRPALDVSASAVQWQADFDDKAG